LRRYFLLVNVALLHVQPMNRLAMAIGLVLSARFEALVAITAILFVAVYLSGFASLFVLRAREPEFLRPFKMWSYPWTNLAIRLASAAFLVASIVTDPRHAFLPWRWLRLATRSIS
jgi:amino acid transporter